MKTIKYLVVLFGITICCLSCLGNKEYVDVKYNNIFRADSLFIRGNNVSSFLVDAVYSWSKEKEDESRLFYTELDSSLVFMGLERRSLFTPNPKSDIWCAIDWRITTIELITNEDYDAKHPAGSLLNDLYCIKYYYKGDFVQKKLSDITYGSLMLTDYFPYPGPTYDTSAFCFEIKPLDENGPSLNSFTIRFYDGFGRVFTVDSSR